MNDSEVPDAFRRWGYLAAALDPLGRLLPERHPELDLQSAAAGRGRAIYCSSIGAEFMHIPDPERRLWVQRHMEAAPAAPDRRRVLDRLIRADIFERVLQVRYPGTRRYSLEGATALIPLLDEILNVAGEHATVQVMMGMSHRGRLNVMAHTLGRRAADIFTRFEDMDPRSILGGGDVKYHIGATGRFRASNGAEMRVSLVSNPSHLEAVDPVVMGRARAWQDRLTAGEASGQASGTAHAKVLPITMHGDAAFAGQGIVAETLNLANLRGFACGGTIHILINNLIGFTTAQPDLHSSRFSGDLARRLAIPIFHVNGEDPEAVVRVARLASEFRYTYHSDVVVDLIGYRLHGHSEIEDPTTTQPRLYEKIKSHPPLWKLYAPAAGVDAAQVDAMANQVRQELDREQEQARTSKKAPPLRELPLFWAAYEGGCYKASFELDTAVSGERLAEVAERITAVPGSFHIHPKIQRGLEQRLEMARGRRPVDWGMAEALAFGSLLWQGTAIRMSGEDSRRGTFNQRHAAWVDVMTEEEYVPLAHLHPSQARFQCYDSPLSEAAPLGFEFGYSRDFPETLVLWEAQFGDFANGAQVIIDQFVSASEDKWGLLSGLVLLLPHGYEGQGPEHSSARLERFLQLAAEDNLVVCQPSTSAQYFHLLRRQALWRWRKPLILLTPKSLLRDPRACSPVDQLTRGRFAPVLGDEAVTDAKKILIGTGKIRHELRSERQRRGDTSTAILALEQIYPFPQDELAAELAKHSRAREVVWVQDEPANMGALFFVRPRLRRLAAPRPVLTVRRSSSASPATGSAKAHAIEEKALLALAFGPPAAG